jgi:hypothetical protein
MTTVWDDISGTSWNDRKLPNTVVTIASVPAEIQTGHSQNTSQEPLSLPQYVQAERVMWLQITGISERTLPSRHVSNNLWDYKTSLGNAVVIAIGYACRMEASPTCTRHFHFTFYCRELFSNTISHSCKFYVRIHHSWKIQRFTHHRTK